MSECLKEKLVFLILKNIMIKILKLTQFSEFKINVFNLKDFEAYTESDTFQRFTIVIAEYDAKYSATFKSIHD